RRHGRGRFVRRAAILFTTLLFLSAFGAVTLVSRLMTGGGGGTVPAIGAAAAIVVVGFLLGAALVVSMRRLALPLAASVDAANRIADNAYSVRVAAEGPRWLRTVGGAFNTMASRLEAQDRQRRNLMADIAHELRTPLSVIQGRLEGLLDGVYPRDDPTIGLVIDETRHLTRLVDDLRTLAIAGDGLILLSM